MLSLKVIDQVFPCYVTYFVLTTPKKTVSLNLCVDFNHYFIDYVNVVLLIISTHEYDYRATIKLSLCENHPQYSGYCTDRFLWSV